MHLVCFSLVTEQTGGRREPDISAFGLATTVRFQVCIKVFTISHLNRLYDKLLENDLLIVALQLIGFMCAAFARERTIV